MTTKALEHYINLVDKAAGFEWTRILKEVLRVTLSQTVSQATEKSFVKGRGN